MKEQPKTHEGLREKLKNKVKSRFNKTEFAQKLYKSDEYKEYTEFKQEMT